MSMVSYSSYSIFCEDSKYLIKIDMWGSMLHLLKIEMLTSHLKKGPTDLEFLKNTVRLGSWSEAWNSTY